MKLILFIGLFVLFLFIAVVPTTKCRDSLSTNNKLHYRVVYGEDDRIDVLKTKNKHWRKWASASAARIYKYWFVKTEDEQGFKFDIIPSNLNVCPGEKFGDQISIADCSGFLISDDLLVTAGHCIEHKWDCLESYWIFDFQIDENNKTPTSFKNDQVYNCIEVIGNSSSDDGDFAIIRLDRKVKNRVPLKLRQDNGIIDDSATLLAIGNPSGLPTKITPNGKILDNTGSIFFYTNLDTFFGNSGSAVINQETGLVEGILVSGDKDYTYNAKLECDQVVHCEVEGNCQDGEGVQRISALLPYLKFMTK